MTPASKIRTILIAAVQVPFFRGGAEIHVEGLRAALHERGYDVEVVSLPFKWYPKVQILKSALAWRLLDLTRVGGRDVDLLICTKFPSYVAQHPNKVTWLIHQHRQAYDWYGTPFGDFSESAQDQYVREAIKRLDQRTLPESRRIYTNSANTAGRLMKYNGIKGTPLYPPVKELPFRNDGHGDYVLSVGRLDKAKRIDDLIKAMRHAGTDARCVIAGSGPELENLQRLAAHLGVEDRVRFAGFVSEDELISLYAGCGCVFFAPIDEDFGYITIEAFRSQKPVVTRHDTGGVLEFVENGVSGLVADDPKGLGQAIRRLLSDRALSQSMGQNGFSRVPATTWDDVVRELVGAG